MGWENFQRGASSTLSLLLEEHLPALCQKILRDSEGAAKIGRHLSVTQRVEIAALALATALLDPGVGDDDDAVRPDAHQMLIERRMKAAC